MSFWYYHCTRRSFSARGAYEQRPNINAFICFSCRQYKNEEFQVRRSLRVLDQQPCTTLVIKISTLDVKHLTVWLTWSDDHLSLTFLMVSHWAHRSTNDLATAIMLSATSPAPSNKQSQTKWPSFVKRNPNDYVRDEKMSHSVTGRSFFSPPAKMNVGPTRDDRSFSSWDETSPLPKTPKESSRGLFFWFSSTQFSIKFSTKCFFVFD